ncbi:hypothetical protein [Virgibacillus sp. CBA3643]|uniref:hypothetical protein n=1 Tax=Virgibacillus sp. CBA3643 TaxID=2942278 RepID=UPI0035A2E5F8
MDVKVYNKGKKSRERLGIRFEPKAEREIEVSSKEYITVKAVKDFNVEIIEEEEEKEESGEDGKEELQELNIDEFINHVKDNDIDIDEAIAIEVAGKNRSTLLDQLEDMKKEDE